MNEQERKFFMGMISFVLVLISIPLSKLVVSPLIEIFIEVGIFSIFLDFLV